MLRKTSLALIPGCVALAVAGGVTISHLLRTPIVVETEQSARLLSYQFRFRCGVALEDGEARPSGTLSLDTLGLVADSIPEVQR